jgi:hypothetical protein
MKKKCIVAGVSLIMVGVMAVAVVGFGNVGAAIQRALGDGPPAPPTLVERIPGPQIPQLTESDTAKAKEIALADARVQELIQGKGWGFGGIGVWHSSPETGLKKIGAGLEIKFEEPCQIAYHWPLIELNEDKDSWPPYREITAPEDDVLQIKGLVIFVDLTTGKVVQILPMPADVSVVSP